MVSALDIHDRAQIYVADVIRPLKDEGLIFAARYVVLNTYNTSSQLKFDKERGTQCSNRYISNERRSQIGDGNCYKRRADLYYHDIRHILKVVSEVRKYVGSESDRELLELAALFHDIVYDPRNQDNEERSAETFESFAKKFDFPPERIAIVKSLILATKTPFMAATPLEQALVDADFSIFAESAEIFKEYVVDIRKEYGHLDGKAFAKGRLQFLNELKSRIENRGALFFNASPKCEKLARLNINWEICRY